MHYNPFNTLYLLHKSFSSKNHPDTGISHANIGVVFSTLNQSDLAFEHYKKVLKVFS